ncbi:hypothetical protein COO91_07906 [Nostoc flagelliforme CCNUN1]|uniref:Uncharacterized protein n=1 Tax=Nostoc flagelliforme CCNUN1 TaxID=2038116 RepID=A0A2K8T2A3_9NOSO|nr:hypothetical protein COO91_00820 [Nostoc flagelliforme CCNUN1]AUB37802.1 hypothetical protein COO91_03754 [Nostoc flagelliforme CCNUN1]AUB39091.1 hypothetical protein COO91_05079 [Nostoc flagelliforme CCNUN1]AUB41824.1 hypothetical protein COO91_07906 [Nostoc flagelliforme CCNUN1]
MVNADGKRISAIIWSGAMPAAGCAYARLSIRKNRTLSIIFG